MPRCSSGNIDSPNQVIIVAVILIVVIVKELVQGAEV